MLGPQLAVGSRLHTRTMSLLKSFAALLLVLSHVTSIAVQATPMTAVLDSMVTLPIAKRFNFTGSSKMLQRDQARARSLRERAMAQATGAPPPSSEVGNISIHNQLVTYTAFVNIGTPPTPYNLIVDTGSANTWVGANQAYVTTSSSRDTGNDVAIDYGYGESMSGVEVTDTLELSPGLVVNGQSIGVSALSSDFAPYDGVLGLGPVDLSIGSLTPDSSAQVATVTQNLYSQGAIAAEVVSMSFEPSTESTSGELTFGGVDPTKFTGQMSYAEITDYFPASRYFGVNQAVTYTRSETLLSYNPGVFDVGTTLVLLATDAFEKYMNMVGGVFDEGTGLYRITPAQYANLQSMFFTINELVCEFTANAQIWPRYLNGMIGGSSEYVYLIVADIGWPSGSGMDIINGMMFMERFYAVFDTGNNRVGVAYTQFTENTSN
ncbi:aspartic peptidase A1 [Cubamyces lactineus]|nr:aspartic peptidase A1 [Cubamyces lactineus]